LRFDADGIVARRVEGTRRRFRDARFATREGEANESARTADGAEIERRAPTERDAGEERGKGELEAGPRLARGRGEGNGSEAR
jgi:hypothetical protein